MLVVDRTVRHLLPHRETFLNAAEGEMAAFVAAVATVQGFEADQLAAECWIEQLNRLGWPKREDPTLRQVTIAAVFRLAKRTGGDPSTLLGPSSTGSDPRKGRIRLLQAAPQMARYSERL
jgi:hypothetical protein